VRGGAGAGSGLDGCAGGNAENLLQLASNPTATGAKGQARAEVKGAELRMLTGRFPQSHLLDGVREEAGRLESVLR
jgi:hypothetical protein